MLLRTDSENPQGRGKRDREVVQQILTRRKSRVQVVMDKVKKGQYPEGLVLSGALTGLARDLDVALRD